MLKNPAGECRKLYKSRWAESVEPAPYSKQQKSITGGELSFIVHQPGMCSVRDVEVKVSKGPEMFFLCLEARDGGGHLLYSAVTVRLFRGGQKMNH